MKKKFFYTRKLPHWQPEEATFFITYRLTGSLPVTIIEQLKASYARQKLLPENQTEDRKEIIRQGYFLSFEQILESNLNEPHWLRNDAIARIVLDSLLFNDNKQYILWAACIMSNHVHILISTLEGAPLLNVILQHHKKFTAVQCNKALNRTGKFWAEESYDTMIRNDRHFHRVVNYILQNPVKAGIVNKWVAFKWNYLHPELEKEYKLGSDKD